MRSKAHNEAVLPNAERIGFLLYRVGLKITQAYEGRIGPLGFSAVEVGTLTHLATGGQAHVRGVARALGVSPQTVVNVTIDLERRRLVVRSRSANDQRAIEMRLTEKGRRAISDIDQVVRQFDADLERLIGVANLGPLTAELLKVLAEEGL